MTEINKLTSVDTVTGSDQVPIYSSSNGDARKASMNTLRSYIGNGIASDIHAATNKTTPADADELPIADSATSFTLKKLTWFNLKATIWAAWGSLIAAGTSKATPVDADGFAIQDSAVANATKKLTFANLWAWVQSKLGISAGSSYVGFLQAGTGAVAGTVQAELRRGVWIEQFGAIGDGVTDDTAAFNAAKALNIPIHLVSGKTYAISSCINATADGQGFICTGKATVLLLSGSGKFDRSDYTGTQFDANACGFYCNGYDNYVLKGIHVKFQTVAAVRTVKAVAIRDSMNSVIDVECSLFQETQGGIVTVDSCGNNCDIKAYVHDCGTSNDTLASMQITGINVDDNKISSISTTHSKISLAVKNINISGAALTKYGYQTDGVNIGTGDKHGLFVDVDAENVGEPFDCFGSFVQANVRAKTCNLTGIKLIHGAQHCDIDAVIDGTDGAAVLIYGTSTGVQETAYNTIRCTASNVGTIGSTLLNAAVLIDGNLTYKPTNNYVFINLKNTGSMDYAAAIIAGSYNTVEFKTNSVQSPKFAGYIQSPATIGNKIINADANYGDYVSGRRYCGEMLNTSSTTALTISANTLYAIPLVIRQTKTFTVATIRISTGVAGNMRLGIYKWQGGIPTDLISDFGTISTAATGEIDLSLFSGAGISLNPGVYALALVSDVGPAVYSTSANVGLMSIVGVSSLGTADCQISRAFTYAALPATWGTPTYGTGNIPNLILRF